MQFSFHSSGKHISYRQFTYNLYNTLRRDLDLVLYTAANLREI